MEHAASHDLSYWPADQTEPFLEISIGDALTNAAERWENEVALVEGVGGAFEDVAVELADPTDQGPEGRRDAGRDIGVAQLLEHHLPREVVVGGIGEGELDDGETEESAVANPSRIPMTNFQDLDFLGNCRPSSAMTFCRSFHTSAFAGGFRRRYAG